MAIKQRLIHFNKEATFQRELSANNIPINAIVFVKETKKIYTHETGYISLPEGGTEGQVLSIKDGTAKWADLGSNPAINSAIEVALATPLQDINSLKQAVTSKIGQDAISDMLTKTEAGEIYQPIGNYVEQATLTNYVSMEALGSQISAALVGYAKATDIANTYPTKEEMQQAIADAQLEGEEIDLSSYAKTADIEKDYLKKSDAESTYQPQGDYLTAQDITGKADTTTVNSHINNTTVHVTADEKSAWSSKQDEITDLATIRSNAKTAFDWGNHAVAGYAKATDVASTYQTKGDYPTKAEMQAAIAAAQLEGEEVDLSGYATKTEVETDYLKKVDAADTYQPKGNYLTTHQDISGKADKTTVDGHINDSDVHVTTSDKSTWNKKQDSIEDLETIRANAADGKIAHGWGNHASAGYAKKTESDSAYQPKGEYLTAQDISGKANKTELEGKADKSELENKADKLDFEGHVNNTTVHVTADEKSKWNDKQDRIADVSTIRSNATTAHSWGDHSKAGYASDSDLTAHTNNTTVHVTANDKSTWSGKQDKIDDLATIRTNATDGKTAYGWGNHAGAGYATQTWVETQGFLKSDSLNGLAKTAEIAQNYVAKESGKTLSSNDYTTVDKNKVANTPTFWYGTKADYDKLATKDESTLYLITEE